MRSGLPTGTVTFLFTDIEGSTRLLHELGPDAYSEALAEHRRILRHAFAEHGGIEVDTQGDAFFVAFPTASGAIDTAREAQAALAPGPIRVRMGIHTGTPTLTAEGYVGVDVHRGARVAALAHGGQVLLTETTAMLVDGEQALTDLGRHRLKDFDRAVRLVQLGPEAFPALRSPGVVSLPTPATRFLGREHELCDAVTLVLQQDPAILTVVGPGGTGKTRFALELARLLSEDAEGGTLFVPLAVLRDPALVLPSIAEALGVESPEPAAIAARLGERRTHLLVDNLEQLLPDAARPLAALADAAPSLRLLVTSREALQVAAESRFDLPPLARDEAVELFLSRARAVRPDVEPTPAVEVICERLDRLPLAIELAAARTRLLAPDALLERLAARLDLPAPRDADQRHATLRATIEWSHDLLLPDEQRLFARLAVFRGGCTLEAAVQVADAGLETLVSLIDKSLVRRRTESDGSARYWMLETIHELAAERLAQQPDSEQILRRHAEWVRAIARAAHMAVDDIGPAEQDPAVVLRERENVRAAIEWTLGHDPALAAEIVVALDQYWPTSALLEGISIVESLLQHGAAVPTALRARLLRSHGGLVLLTEADLERGEERYREALALFRELGDDASVVGLLARFAVHASYRDDTTEARRLVAEVRSLNESVANPLVEPQMLSSLGTVARREGDLRAALDLYRRSADASSRIGFLLWTLWQLDNKLDVEVELGLLADAKETARAGLALAQRLEDRRLTCSLLINLGLALLKGNELEHAGTIWGSVLMALRELPSSSAQHLAAVAAPLRDCTDERFVEAVERGQDIPLDEAVALVLGEPQTEP